MKATKTRSTTLPVDIYSTDTLRPVDLCASLADELACLRLNRRERSEVTKAATLARHYDSYRDEAYDEKYHEAYEGLIEIAENHLPPYTYYGSSEGDGACIGVWPCVDSVVESVDEGDMARCDDEGFAPDGYEGLAVSITDHGNVTLYNVKRGKYTEVWSAV